MYLVRERELERIELERIDGRELNWREVTYTLRGTDTSLPEST